MGNITASRTQLKGDPRHNSLLVSKFVNCLMWDGKKTTAQRVFYDALDLIQERMPKEDSLEVFVQAVENVKPQIEVRSKRVGGAAYVTGLTRDLPSAVNATYHAEIVRQRALLRRVIEAGTRIVQAAYDGAGEADDIVNRAQAEMYEISAGRSSGSP